MRQDLAAAPWLPGCIKASRGSNGLGFRTFSDARGWAAAQRAYVRFRQPMVVQPLLSGAEYRISVTAAGDYAVAKLVQRRGLRSQWDDCTAAADRRVLTDVRDLARLLDAPVVGADIIAGPTGYFLLDLNLGPSLSLHLATDQPRDLAPAVLDCWLRMRGDARSD